MQLTLEPSGTLSSRVNRQKARLRVPHGPSIHSAAERYAQQLTSCQTASARVVHLLRLLLPLTNCILGITAHVSVSKYWPQQFLYVVDTA